ncbi:MAG: GspE/PulE family protein [bacterium]|nr:GspE/PulE family protein [bacterium]
MFQIPLEQLKNTLVSDGVIRAEEFSAISEESARLGKGPAELLIARGTITEEYYNNLLANFYGVPMVALDPSTIDIEVVNLISEEVARSRRVIPFSIETDGTVNLAMEDPSDLGTIQFLETRLQRKMKPFLAPRSNFASVFAVYGKKQVESFKKIIQDNIRASLSLSDKKDSEAAGEVPIISITDNIISYAYALRASDVHIEALEKEILVRYRIDGILHEVIRIQKEIHPAIVARFKILSGMKLDEHTNPQDGRFRYRIGNDMIDIRVSILPTFYGEKVEMRLLTTGGHLLTFEELGMNPEMIKILTENITKTYGIVLITGPTGSGKSTTLYSILSLINKPEVNIITVEDPIEYEMKYVNQTQINEAAGITFASALRSILRQDPNIIMVGEIRDKETAEISVHAALTGHLVLSSLHTNDAPTAVPRMLDMRIEPFLISAVMNAVLAQRLVRRICLDCLYSYQATPEIEQTIRKQMNDLNIPADVSVPKTFFRGKGCSNCSHTGYRGRMGIFELMRVNEKVRQLIVDPKFTLDQLRNLARSEGMKSMFEDGLEKSARGNTTIEEVLRVIRE